MFCARNAALELGCLSSSTPTSNSAKLDTKMRCMQHQRYKGLK